MKDRPADSEEIFYHGSPVKDLTSLKPGSYVTPDATTAYLMGRFHKNTVKPWSDDDLDEPYKFGTKIRFRPGREPTGKPVVYAIKVNPKILNLLDNPHEHITTVETPVKKINYEQLGIKLAIDQSAVLEMRRAKTHSDKRDYAKKHEIMRRLIARYPQAFRVDDPKAPMAGVTHEPSNFRMHLPVEMTRGLTGSSVK